MFTMLVSIFTWVAFLWIWFISSAAVGIYIFKNSKKHRMNTVLWVVIGLVFNVFGLCAYFIARDKTDKMYCPVCGAKTEEWEPFCPQCDTKLESVRPKMKFITKAFIGVCTASAVMMLAKYIFTVVWSQI